VEVRTDRAVELELMVVRLCAVVPACGVPCGILVLWWSGCVTPEKLAEKRAYVVQGALVLGMFLAPPDFISQTLLAIPMYLLFEVGIFMAKRLLPPKKNGDVTPD